MVYRGACRGFWEPDSKVRMSRDAPCPDHREFNHNKSSRCQWGWDKRQPLDNRASTSHFTDYSEPKATLEQPARFGWPRNTTVTHGIPEVDDQTTCGKTDTEYQQRFTSSGPPVRRKAMFNKGAGNTSQPDLLGPTPGSRPGVYVVPDYRCSTSDTFGEPEQQINPRMGRAQPTDGAGDPFFVPSYDIVTGTDAGPNRFTQSRAAPGRRRPPQVSSGHDVLPYTEHTIETLASLREPSPKPFPRSSTKLCKSVRPPTPEQHRPDLETRLIGKISPNEKIYGQSGPRFDESLKFFYTDAVAPSQRQPALNNSIRPPTPEHPNVDRAYMNNQ